MGKLKSFESLDIKEKSFAKTNYFRIDTKTQFDEWFDYYTSARKELKKTDFIYRGMGDSRHKLYTSAQRAWIINDTEEWAKDGYIAFIDAMVQKAKNHPLLKKVFDIYEYGDIEREFPVLSILQHYSAPTPLMDWTYNINVALFFATEALSGGNGIGEIDNYFSVHRIDKSKYPNEFLSIFDFDQTRTTGLLSYKDWTENPKNPNKNGIFYISDFDEGNAFGAMADSKVVMKEHSRPYTSIYNQNIIPQEGLFIFNPFSRKTIDDVFSPNLEQEGWNLELKPFECFNIKKDLADYIRRHIKEKYAIDKSFIYPHLYDDAVSIKNSVLNVFAK